MANTSLLAADEEKRLLSLLQNQPRSAKALAIAISRIRDRAIPLVLSDSRVRERLKDTRYRVLGGNLKFEKMADGKLDARRLAEGGIYDYDRDVLIVVTIDLRRGRVIDLKEHPRVQPGISAEELEAAREIVLADRKYRSMKKKADLQVAAFPSKASVTADHPAYGHRCFVLYFWSAGKRSKMVAQATVDLSAQSLTAPVPEETGDEQQ